MPSSQQDHLIYTVNEWTKYPYTQMLKTVFDDKSVKTFVDIGANVGGVEVSFHHLGYLKQLDKVICFEPDGDNYHFLTNICNELKKDSNVNAEFVCYNFGIYYGKTESHVCGAGDNNVGGYFLADDKITTTRPFAVYEYDGKIFKLDEIEKYIDNEKGIDFVKIDIEGGELNLLENSVILREKCKYMLLEWHYSPEELYKFYELNLSSHYTIIIGDTHHNQYLLKNKTL